jgi:hypothetical protein
MSSALRLVVGEHVECGATPGAVVLVEQGDDVDVLEVGTTAFRGRDRTAATRCSASRR